jgi:hypothetical protein
VESCDVIQKVLRCHRREKSDSIPPVIVLQLKASSFYLPFHHSPALPEVHPMHPMYAINMQSCPCGKPPLSSEGHILL